MDLEILTSRLSSRELPRCVATFLCRCRQWQKAQDRLVDDGFALGHSPSEFTHHYFSCWSLWWEGSFNESHSCRAHRPPPVFPHLRIWKTDFNPPSRPQFFFHMSPSSPIFLALTSLIYRLSWHALPLTATNLTLHLFSLFLWAFTPRRQDEQQIQSLPKFADLFCECVVAGNP